VAAAREPNLDKTKIRPMTVSLTASYDSGTTSRQLRLTMQSAGLAKSRVAGGEVQLPCP